MADLSQLTDAELEELEASRQPAQSEAPEAQAAQQAPVDLSQLTDDELDELVELKAEQKIGSVEATTRNFIQGATLGTGDELGAFAQAGIRKLSGDQTEFNEAYTQERDNIRARNELAREAQPIAGIAAEIGGGILTTGGVGGLVKNLGLGAIAGLGFSEEETAAGMAQDAALGTLLTAAGHGALKGGGSLLKKARVKLAKQPPAIQKSVLKVPRNEHPRSKRLRTATLKDSMNEKLDITDATEGGFQDRVNQFIDIDAPKIVDDKLNDAYRALGVRSQEILENNQNIKLNANELIDEVREAFKLLPNVGDEALASKKITEDFFDILSGGKLRIQNELVDPENITFSQAQEIKTMLDKQIHKNVKGLDLTDDSRMFKRAKNTSIVVETFNKKLRKQISKLDTTGKLAQLNEEYSALYDAMNFKPTNAQDFISMLPGMGNAKTVQRARTFMRALEAADPELAMDIAENLQPGMTQYQLALTASSGMRESVADVFRTKAIMGVNPLLAPLGISEGTQVVIANKVGRAGIKSFKFPRTIKGMFENQEMVVSRLSQINPSLAVVMEDALVDRDVDAVKEIATSALEDPASVNLFEQGMGFEGELSQLEIQQIIQQVKADPSLTTRQKLSAITQAKAGQMPQIEPPQEPFMRQYQARPRNEDGRKQ